MQNKEYDKRYESIFHNAPHGMAIVSIDGKWLEVNDKICQITGYNRDELTTFQEITHPDDLKKDLGFLKKLIDREIDSYKIEKRYIKKDNSIVWINLSVSAVFDENNCVKYFISQIEDITNSKITKYRKQILFDDSLIGLAICDEFGKWIEVNSRFAQKLGYKKAELLQTDFQSITYKEDLDEDIKILNGFLNNEFEAKKWKKRYVKKDSSLLWCVLNVRKSYDLETNRPIFICSIQNINDIILLEDQINKTNDQLIKTVEELTHFNYFASHDLKENIRTIYNYCKILKEESPDKEEAEFYLNRVLERSSQLNDLINDLLIYTKISSKKIKNERFSLYNLILSINEEFKGEILKKNIDFEYNFDQNEHIWCHKTTLYHILFNLISNSIKYSSTKITIHLKKGKFKTLIKIEDNGEGIEKIYHKKVFEPFFRLSTKMNGTGLGLSLCKKMLEKLGGQIGLKSQINEQTIFWFYF